MSGGILIGFGIGIIFTALLTSMIFRKWSLIPITIGIILIILAIITLVTDDLDCKNYCQCKGMPYYELYGLNCKCYDENLVIKKGITNCRIKCNAWIVNRTSHYDEATGKCYCT